jgi:hypothetical protein
LFLDLFFRGLQGLFCLDLVGNIPGNPLKTYLFSVNVPEEIGIDFEYSGFTIFSADFPENIVYAFSGIKHVVKTVKGKFRIGTIHEMPEVLIFNLFSRVPEYATEGIVEEDKVSLDGGFKKRVGHILYKNTIAVLGDITGFQLTGIVEAAGIMRRSFVQFKSLSAKGI